ncbi:MAG: DUF1848 domain-containing protein [Fibrobacterota bacterium]
MIISASRRTDIPCYHTSWFLNRLRAGYCLVKNPFNGKFSRVSLLPDDVDALFFWTRDASSILPHIKYLKDLGLNPFFLYTITGYPGYLEPGSPSVHSSIRIVKSISEILGPERIAWRYDPVILAENTGPEFHKKNFRFISGNLQGHVSRCIISFLDIYRKNKTSAEKLGLSGKEDFLKSSSLLRFFKNECLSTGITPGLCCETDFSETGIKRSPCIDTSSAGIKAPKDTGQRPECLCGKSRDIGAYDTCPRGCVFCYASGNKKIRPSDPKSEYL